MRAAAVPKIPHRHFQHASRLCDIAVKKYAADKLFLLSAFPLAQIENLWMDGSIFLRSITECLDILSLLPKLIEFTGPIFGLTKE